MAAPSITVVNLTPGGPYALVQLAKEVPAGIGGSILLTDTNTTSEVLNDSELVALLDAGTVRLTTAGGELSDPGVKTNPQSKALNTDLHDLDIKHNLTATVGPAGTDNEDTGYSIGSLWLVTAAGLGTQEMYRCVSAAAFPGAVWLRISTFFRYSVGPDGSNAVYRPENTAGSAIQTAIDAAAASSDGFGIVPILPGTYTEALSLESGVSLKGFGDRNPGGAGQVLIIGDMTIVPAFGPGSGSVAQEITILGKITFPAIPSSGQSRFRRVSVFASTGPAVEFLQFGVIEGGSLITIFDDCQLISADPVSTIAALELNGTGTVGCINGTDIQRFTLLGAPADAFKAISVSRNTLAFADSNTRGYVDVPAGAGPIVGSGAIIAQRSWFQGGDGAAISALTFSGGAGASTLSQCAVATFTTPAISVTVTTDYPALSGITYPFDVGTGVGVAAGDDWRDLQVDPSGYDYVTQMRLFGIATEVRQRGIGVDVIAAGRFSADGDSQGFQMILRDVNVGVISTTVTAPLDLDVDPKTFVIETGKMYKCILDVQAIDSTGPGVSFTTWRQESVFYKQPGGPPAVVAAGTITTVLQGGAPFLALDVPTIIAFGGEDYASFGLTNTTGIPGSPRTFNINAHLKVIEIPGVPVAS